MMTWMLVAGAVAACKGKGSDDSGPAVVTDDADGDGYDSSVDCNDSNSAINPSAGEVCDGVDNNCDDAIDEAGASGETAYFTDSDGDGQGSVDGLVMSCAMPEGAVDNHDDCDDTESTIFTGAPELCDNLDNDCNGSVDDGAGTDTYFADNDGDGFGNVDRSIAACGAPEGYVVDDTDCDDADRHTHPGAIELCDGQDNDCDGAIETGGASTYYVDSDGDLYGDPAASAVYCADPGDGYAAVDGDCDDGDSAINPAALELCDGVDNDCDSEIDAGVATTYYTDVDLDGFGDPSTGVDACEESVGHVVVADDCDDADGAIHPGATEYCDSIDNDCDGLVDADDPDAADARVYRDLDDDTYGDPSDSMLSCVAVDGYVTDASDCDDGDVAINPGADEVCDSVDNDCDSLVDDADDSITDAVAYYPDVDHDTYGSDAGVVAACSQPRFYIATGGDCDDSDAAIKPSATEVCDGADNDCDTLVDSDDDSAVLNMYYFDSDGDNYGDPGMLEEACEAPSDYVGNDLDCDDGDATISPDATEVYYDGTDQDCDGLSDYDADLDGYVSDVYGGDDCDDADGMVSPGAFEECGDGIDNDCDGTIDTGCVLHGTHLLAESGNVLKGAGATDYMGQNLTRLDDVDGDGYDELLFGVAYNDAGSSQGGAAYWVDGSDSGSHVVTDVADATILGETADGYLGTSVAAGDLNDDGEMDMIAGATGINSSRGRAYVFYGPASGDILSGDADAWFGGTSAGQYLGAALASGDFDGDGFDDLAIGSPYAATYAGAVYLLYGPLDGTPTLSDGVAVTGEAEYQYLGGRTVNVGDVDGDGADELALGGSYSDKAYLVDGALSSGVVPSDRSITTSVAYSYVGMAMAGADIDDDGYGDLVVSAPYLSSPTVTSAGAVMVVAGPITGAVVADTDAFVTIWGDTSATGIGFALATGRDVDGDGSIDMMIGNSYYSSGRGAGLLFYGPFAGSYTVADVGGILKGTALADYAGSSVSMGHFSSSSVEDVAVSAPYANGASTDAGQIVFFTVPE